MIKMHIQEAEKTKPNIMEKIKGITNVLETFNILILCIAYSLSVGFGLCFFLAVFLHELT